MLFSKIFEFLDLSIDGRIYRRLSSLTIYIANYSISALFGFLAN